MTSKTDLEFVLTALRHALGGMRAVQEHAPQGTAAAHYASELEQAIIIINRMQQDETSDVTYTKSDVEALLAIALAAKAKVSHDACKHPRAWRTQAVCGICLKEVGEI